MRRILILLAALTLIATACGDDADPGDTAADDGAATTTTTAAGDGASTTAAGDAGTTTAPAGATLDLEAEKIAFSTGTLTAAPGEVTIRFANKDAGIPHNLHVTGAGVDEKTEVEQGPHTASLTVTLAAGTYRYVCDVHPTQMTGELRVG